MNQNIYGRKLEFYTYEMIQAWKIRFHQQNLDKVAFSAFTINIYIYRENIVVYSPAWEDEPSVFAIFPFLLVNLSLFWDDPNWVWWRSGQEPLEFNEGDVGIPGGIQVRWVLVWLRSCSGWKIIGHFMNDQLVGGLEHVLFFHILGMIIPTDELHHFSEGVGIPPTSHE
jgi:hypothetical protein